MARARSQPIGRGATPDGRGQLETRARASAVVQVSTARGLAAHARGRSWAIARVDTGCPWRERFLLALEANSGNVSAACRDTDIGRQSAYRRRDADPRFAEDWDHIVEQAWPSNRAAFLVLIEQHGSPTRAIAELGLSRAYVYRKRASDEGFAEAWSQLDEQWTDVAEDGFLRRVVAGTERPIFGLVRKSKRTADDGSETEEREYGQIGSIRQFSHAREQFFLAHRRPGRWSSQALGQESKSAAEEARQIRADVEAMLGTMDSDLDLPETDEA